MRSQESFYTHTLDMDYVYRQNLVSLLITD